MEFRSDSKFSYYSSSQAGAGAETGVGNKYYSKCEKTQAHNQNYRASTYFNKVLAKTDQRYEYKCDENFEKPRDKYGEYSDERYRAKKDINTQRNYKNYKKDCYQTQKEESSYRFGGLRKEEGIKNFPDNKNINYCNGVTDEQNLVFSKGIDDYLHDDVKDIGYYEKSLISRQNKNSLKQNKIGIDKTSFHQQDAFKEDRKSKSQERE